MEQRPFDAPSSNTSGLGNRTVTGTGLPGPSSPSAGTGNTSTGEHLKEQGRHLAEQASGQIKGRIQDLTQERKSQATGALEAVSRALRAAGDNLCQEGLDPVGKLGLRAADSVDRAASYLRRSDLDTLVSDAQGVVRSHPEVLLGGAVLCGILVGRFLRSSAPPTREVVFEPDFGLEHGYHGSPRSSGDGQSFGSGGDRSPFAGAGMDDDRPPQGGWA